jgi:sec-independent protein translocase protein TatA
MGLRDPFIWLVIILLFVLLFGTKKLPDLAKNIVLAMKEFKKATKDAKDATETPEIQSKDNSPEKKDETKA